MRSSTAYIEVFCDKCPFNYQSSEKIELTTLANGSYDERNVDSELKSMGWKVDNELDICPDCQEDEEEASEEREDE